MKKVLRKLFLAYALLFIVSLFLPHGGTRDFAIIFCIAVMAVTGMWLLLLRARKKGGGWEQQRLAINSPEKRRKRNR